MTKIKIKRVLPSPKAIFGLLRFRKPIFNSKKRRLARALTIYDLRKIAKRRTPKAPFDYTDGGADSESSLKNARATFENVQFVPRVLRDVSQVDSTVNLLGKKSALPFGIAPTGFTRMMQTEGEIAGCTAAMDARIPFTLSTMGTRFNERVG